MNINKNLNFTYKNDISSNDNIISNGLVLPVVNNSIKTRGNLCYNPESNSIMLYDGYNFINQAIDNVTFINSNGTTLNPNIPKQFVLIDTSNNSVSVTLPNAIVPGITISFSLLSEDGLFATVKLLGGGNFILNSTFPQKSLIYTSNMGWIPYGNSLNYDYFVSSQNGTKMIGNSGGQLCQGTSLALSADGNTLAVGSFDDLDVSGMGCTMIFTRFTNKLGVISWIQQATLVGTGNIGGNTLQGYSVSLSADGNTLAVGSTGDNGGAINGIGATWIFIRSGTTWTQQAKLVGTGNVGASQQGISTTLSADGNTLAVGGSRDNNSEGATWVFVRNSTTGVWTQQGNKLFGTGGAISSQGSSVSLSANGNTLAVGGYTDANGGNVTGAVWIFTRSGTTWTQLGNKLLGTGNDPSDDATGLGTSVSFSADANILVSGGPSDTNDQGAVWTWYYDNLTNPVSYQPLGVKITGTNNNIAQFGTSAKLSSDGNTMVVGGNQDGDIGAIWVFTKPSGINSGWTQQGNKLVGTGFIGSPEQGSEVAMSSYGNVVVQSGLFDNTNVGAFWTFT